MEVYAGFQENCDHEIGRVVKSIEDLGIADNTLVIYIWGDNGSSMEGTETGSFNEMTMQNGIPLTPEQQLKLIERLRRDRRLGRAELPAALRLRLGVGGQHAVPVGQAGRLRTSAALATRWSCRGRSESRTRAGCARSSPTSSTSPRPSSKPPASPPRKRWTASSRCRCTATSFAYTFDDAKAKERHTQQYFEILGNRAMYKDGWIACSRLDRIPWKLDPAALKKFAPGSGWDPDKDKWELYNLDEDFSEATDLAAKHPEKLAELKKLFWEDAEKYHVTPLLGGFAVFYGIPVPPGADRTKFTYYPGHRERRLRA